MQLCLVVNFVFVLTIGCTPKIERSFVLDNGFVKSQTGLDPSKIAVLTGAITSRIVDVSQKLERKEMWIKIAAVDGVALPTSLEFCCEPLPADVKQDDSGDYFGYIWISSKGGMVASEYAKSRGIPPYEELIMNSPDLRVQLGIRILGKASEP